MTIAEKGGDGDLFPTWAGMDPRPSPPWSRWTAASRACGDGPTDARAQYRIRYCSLREWGWSRHRRDAAEWPGLLSVPAGMVPTTRAN
ncbi:hypothetical protein JCM4814A_00220 [Streptomyces phaeofaciens JCM 4814]|uniref:Uncharacterized protein n=1 Tax=Streptomyces phaeofaciens TaxID=68254 RepID=A0A918M1W7_9ACTN|nr:hypothetical protein GCM10010226_88130 [Streptomyces phaeofaciens]